MSHIGLYWVHGRDAKPWGTKSQGLRDVAAEFGLEMLAPDFRGVMDPDQRVRMLVETIGDRPGPLVLVGSSMGGYVSTATCHELDVSRVFALAPAFGLPGYRWQEFPWLQTPVEIVAGWRDAVVPVENILGFARAHGSVMHLCDDEHRLKASLPWINGLFRSFLAQAVAELAG